MENYHFLFTNLVAQGNLQTSGIGELKLYVQEELGLLIGTISLKYAGATNTNSEEWSKVIVDISSYVGKEIQIKFSYRDKEPSTPNNSGNIAMNSISIETCVPGIFLF